MNNILEILSNRRVWAGIVGGLAFILELAQVGFKINVPVLTDLLSAFGGALATLVVSGLALWSYFKPKK